MPHVLRMVTLSLLLALATLAGCDTAQPGVKNSAGSITTTLPADPEAVTAAADRALKDMKLMVLSHEVTQLDGRVVARTARDDRVKVDVERAGEGTSKVSIRVGTFGDESTALTILSRIQRHLGVEATEPTDTDANERVDAAANDPAPAAVPAAE